MKLDYGPKVRRDPSLYRIRTGLHPRAVYATCLDGHAAPIKRIALWTPPWNQAWVTPPALPTLPRSSGRAAGESGVSARHPYSMIPVTG